MKVNMYLYQYQNKVSQRKYYGITVNTKRRNASHKWAAKTKKTPFYDAVRKYGWEGFEFSVISEGTQEEISLEEIRLISEDTGCYNLHLGGNTGYNVSAGTRAAEWKLKLRAGRAGGKPALGLKHSEETKKLCGEYSKAWWDKKGRYPKEVLDYGFTVSNKKFGISKTQYYRLRKAVQA